MKRYKSKLNIELKDYYGALALWMLAIVCTLGFAAIPFQIWLAKVVLDNLEVEESDFFAAHERIQNDLQKTSRPSTDKQSQWD